MASIAVSEWRASQPSSADAAAGVVLLWFTSDDDAPCAVMEREFVRTIEMIEHEVEVRRIDVVRDPVAVAHHRILTIPTIIVVVEGTERKRLLGARNGRKLAREIASVVSEVDLGIGARVPTKATPQLKESSPVRRLVRSLPKVRWIGDLAFHPADPSAEAQGEGGLAMNRPIVLTSHPLRISAEKNASAGIAVSGSEARE